MTTSPSDQYSTHTAEPSTSGGASVHHPGDAVALIRRSFGRLPRNSLVVVGLRDGSAGGHLRMDLPSGDRDFVDAAQQAAYWIAGPEAKPGPEAALIAVFTDERPDVYSELMMMLSEVLDSQYGVLGAQHWAVSQGRVWDPDTDERPGTSVGMDLQAALQDTFRRLPELAEAPEAADAEAAVAEFLAPEPTEGWVRAEAVHTESDRLRRPQEAYQALSAWDIAINETTRTCSTEWVNDAQRAAVLLAAAHQPMVRDALMPLAALDIDTAALGLEQLSSGGNHRIQQGLLTARQLDRLQDFCRAVYASTDERPQWKRIDAFEQLLQALVPYAREEREELLALKSWVLWAKGRGTESGAFIDRCLDEQPDSSLGRFLLDVTTGGGPSGWARVKLHSYSWWKSSHSP